LIRHSDNFNMKVAITGSTGYIGGYLGGYLSKKGYEVLAVDRHQLQQDPARLASFLEGSGVVIHLAGAPVIGRWTDHYREVIYNSRIKTTEVLVQAMKGMYKRPALFICASAVGIYPDTGVYNESDTRIAEGFLGEVCRDWEYEAGKANVFTRVLMLRFGVVLGRGGGALQRMNLPFRFGLGAKIGHGKQMMSWIHIDDLLRAVDHMIKKKTILGPVNVVSPQPISNKAFTKALAKTLNRPAWFTIPAFALRLIYGRGASALTEGQAALPEKLQQSGFQFQYPDIDHALKAIYR
jgi:uncharacterized protein